MQVTLEKKSETLASVVVNLEENDYAPQYNQRLKEYSKNVQVKGFRPGKVPSHIVKSMAGDGLLADEVFKVLSSTIQGYIKENKIKIIGEPLPNPKENNRVIDWKTLNGIDFTYDIGIIPAFEVDLSDKLKFDKYEVEIDDKTLNETIENLLKQNGETKDVEVVAEDDFISGTILKEGEEGEGVTTGLPLTRVIDKQQKAFIGKKIGETVVFDVNKTFDNSDHIAHVVGVSKEEAENVSGKYAFTITKISHQSKGELNQEFFDKVLGKDTVKDEAGFKEKVKEILTQNYNSDSKSVLYKEFKEQLIAKTKIDVSAEFFKRWLLETNKESLKAEYLDENFDKYENELKWSLLRNKISEENDLKVQNEEVKDAAFDQLRMQYLGGMELTPEMSKTFDDFVEKYLRENKGENYMQIFEQVLTQKVFSLIEEKVTLKAKKVKSEEFKKIVEKQ